MRRKKLQRKYRVVIWEFIRYSLAGNLFFWSTYILFFVFNSLLGWSEFAALTTGSILGHVVYFATNKSWVFTEDKSRRKTRGELLKFALFMTFNFFLNLGIVLGLSKLGISPYIGQFIAAGFFTFWNFAGFKLWVFKPDLRKRTAKKRVRRA